MPMTDYKPVKTYVVGFSPDATIGPPARVNSNIARAGGTCAQSTSSDPNTLCQFTAQNEIQLTEALQSVVFDVIKGSYSTSPLTSASGIQTIDSVITSSMVLDSRVDFPSWEGHLIAYESDDAACIAAGAASSPCILWDATAVNETIQLYERLRERKDLHLGCLFINRIPRAWLDEKEQRLVSAELDAASGTQPWAPNLALAEHLIRRRRIADKCLRGLRRDIDLPTMAFDAHDEDSPAVIEALSQAIERTEVG